MHKNMIMNRISWVPFTHPSIKRLQSLKLSRRTRQSPVLTVITTVPDLIDFAKKTVDTYPTIIHDYRDMAHNLLDVWMDLDERRIIGDQRDIDHDDSDHDDYDI